MVLKKVVLITQNESTKEGGDEWKALNTFADNVPPY